MCRITIPLGAWAPNHCPVPWNSPSHISAQRQKIVVIRKTGQRPIFIACRNPKYIHESLYSCQSLDFSIAVVKILRVRGSWDYCRHSCWPADACIFAECVPSRSERILSIRKCTDINCHEEELVVLLQPWPSLLSVGESPRHTSWVWTHQWVSLGLRRLWDEGDIWGTGSSCMLDFRLMNDSLANLESGRSSFKDLVVLTINQILRFSYTFNRVAILDRFTNPTSNLSISSLLSSFLRDTQVE